MELFVALPLLYVAQCATRLPAGSVLFIETLGRVRVIRGGGWRLLHPLPSGRSWTGAPPGPASDVATGFDVPRFEAASLRLFTEDRVLVSLADTYLALLLAAPPLAGLWLGDEAALLHLLPALLLAHGATLAAGWSAHRKLLPDSAAERFQLLFAAALYPPAALRLGHDLRRAVLDGFDPALVAAALLPAAHRRAFLCAELARVEKALTSNDRSADWEVLREVRRGILQLSGSIGWSRPELLTPPEREDPIAAGYCPICASDYRRDVVACADCDVSLLVYQAGPEPAASATPG